MWSDADIQEHRLVRVSFYYPISGLAQSDWVSMSRASAATTQRSSDSERRALVSYYPVLGFAQSDGLAYQEPLRRGSDSERRALVGSIWGAPRATIEEEMSRTADRLVKTLISAEEGERVGMRRRPQPKQRAKALGLRQFVQPLPVVWENPGRRRKSWDSRVKEIGPYRRHTKIRR